mmetsp:Transcript_18842/g.33140  ORF Transcript_18842/g.33140 Transcript_18842/m.33140 type:complete len:210 (+) Transcript_18842:188-817(+)
MMRRSSAFSCTCGFPMRVVSIRSIFSQSQVQATSWSVSQSLGTSERIDASMTALNSPRLISPLYFASVSAKTSHSSCKRYEFATFITMLSNCSRIVPIHKLLPKPITAPLNMNISLKDVGTFMDASRAAASRASPLAVTSPFFCLPNTSLLVIPSSFIPPSSPSSPPSPSSPSPAAASSSTSMKSAALLLAVFQEELMILMRTAYSRRM